MKARPRLVPEVPSAPPVDGRMLSHRQGQVAELVACGLSDKEIAARLAISEETVATYLKRLYRRCRIHSRAALARQLPGPRGPA